MIDQRAEEERKLDAAFDAKYIVPSQKKAAEPEFLRMKAERLRPFDEQIAVLRQRLGDPVVKLPETASATPMFASNPKTGERIMSTDGGKTWQPAR